MTIERFMSDVKTSFIALCNSEIHPKFATLTPVAKTRIIMKTCMVAVAVGLVTALINPVLGSVIMLTTGVAAFAYLTEKYNSTNSSDESFGFNQMKDVAKSVHIKEIVESKIPLRVKMKAIAISLFNWKEVKTEWENGKYANAIVALMP